MSRSSPTDRATSRSRRIPPSRTDGSRPDADHRNHLWCDEGFRKVVTYTAEVQAFIKRVVNIVQHQPHGLNGINKVTYPYRSLWRAPKIGRTLLPSLLVEM